MFDKIKEWFGITNTSLKGRRGKLISLYLVPTIIFFVVLVLLFMIVGLMAFSLFYTTDIVGGGGGAMSFLVILIFIGIIALSVVFGTLLEFSLTYKAYQMFHHQDENVNMMQDFFLLFRNGYFGQYFLMFLVRSIFIFFWTLLLIVPGIIKAVAYSQSSFIFIEKMQKGQRISATECITESRFMMRGYMSEGFVWLLVIGIILNAIGIIIAIVAPRPTEIYMGSQYGYGYNDYYSTMDTTSPFITFLNYVNLVYVIFMLPFYYMGQVVFNAYLKNNGPRSMQPDYTNNGPVAPMPNQNPSVDSNQGLSQDQLRQQADTIMDNSNQEVEFANNYDLEDKSAPFVMPLNQKDDANNPMSQHATDTEALNKDGQAFFEHSDQEVLKPKATIETPLSENDMQDEIASNPMSQHATDTQALNKDGQAFFENSDQEVLKPKATIEAPLSENDMQDEIASNPMSQHATDTQALNKDGQDFFEHTDQEVLKPKANIDNELEAAQLQNQVADKLNVDENQINQDIDNNPMSKHVSDTDALNKDDQAFFEHTDQDVLKPKANIDTPLSENDMQQDIESNPMSKHVTDTQALEKDGQDFFEHTDQDVLKPKANIDTPLSENDMQQDIENNPMSRHATNTQALEKDGQGFFKNSEEVLKPKANIDVDQINDEVNDYSDLDDLDTSDEISNKS